MNKRNAIFAGLWMKHKYNATKAYQELNPHVSYESARVLGSRLLARVNIRDVLKQHELDIAPYIEAIQEGLDAHRRVKRGNRTLKEPDWRTRIKYHTILGKLLKIE